jgi:hypothetical protein
MKYTKAEQEAARVTLRELLPPGSTVHTTVKHVARSGMSRSISCYVIRDDSPRWIDSLICKAVGYTFDEKREAVKIGGCGMDMGFAIVYDLAYSLWGKNFSCIGKGCPSNDHSNGDRDYTPHAHSDGGYALRQRWL